MAELPSSSEKALQKLKEQLTCSVCLDQYTNPKLLECFHVFCENCIKPLPVRQTATQGQVVECPNCRQPTSLPQNGVAGLRGAFLIHHLFDIHDTLEKVSAPAKTQCNKCKKRNSSCYCRTCKFICEKCKDFHSEWEDFSTHEIVSLEQLTTNVVNHVSPAKKVLQCTSHPEKPVDLFCETCEEMICRDCIVKVHRDHQYDLVRAAFSKHKDEIVAALQPVEQQLASVNKGIEGLDKLCLQISDQRQTLKSKVKSTMQQIHQALEAREKELMLEIDRMADQKLKNTAAQKDHIELFATRLKSCHDFVQESLKTGSQEEVLTIKKSVMHRVREMMAEFKPEMLVGEEKANMRFYHQQKEELLQTCRQFGEVMLLPLDPNKCQAKGKGLHIAVVGETATATVQLKTGEGKSCKFPVDVQCKLVSRNGSSKVRGEVKQTQAKCEISYRPQHSGQHHLRVRVEGMNIARSPFPISAITTTPTSTITELNGPCGVAVNDQGQIIVTENLGHCVTVINKNGDKRSFGTKGSGPGQVQHPVYVALTNTGGVLVNNVDGKTIQHFSLDGTSVNYTKAQGSGPVQPYDPLGIVVHPHTNKIYITDNSNHCIQIHNADLTHSGSFGGKGSHNGQFNGPHGVSFDSSSNLYVADSNNHRVQVFTAGGDYVRQFRKKGNREGYLYTPLGVAIDSNDIVYVSEWGNHRISLFTQDGQFLTSFGRKGNGPGQFNCPTDVAIGSDGKVYVTDSENGRIQVF